MQTATDKCNSVDSFANNAGAKLVISHQGFTHSVNRHAMCDLGPRNIKEYQ